MALASCLTLADICRLKKLTLNFHKYAIEKSEFGKSAWVQKESDLPFSPRRDLHPNPCHFLPNLSDSRGIYLTFVAET